MKHLFFIFLLTISSVSAKAQASYGDGFFTNYIVKINVETKNDSTSLHVIFQDTEKRMVDEPRLLLKLMDDSVIELKGKFFFLPQ